VSKKIKQNRYKPGLKDDKALQPDSGSSIDFCLKCIMTVAFISVVSLASVFIFDFITQSEFFNIKKIEILGAKRVPRKKILELAGLNRNRNIYGINLYSIEKLIASDPWIQSALVKRDLALRLTITIIEQEPLAIVKIENLSDILINTQGRPFKEYNPEKDRIGNLPVISGLDLTEKNKQYEFNGPLFNSIMDFLKTDGSCSVKQITGDKNTGIMAEVKDIYNQEPAKSQGTIQMKLGFDNFKAKLNKAIKISEYIDKNFPARTICAMDLFDIKKVFIKTKLNHALHNNLAKGV